jgi:sarcosine oxidase delta subunit
MADLFCPFCGGQIETDEYEELGDYADYPEEIQCPWCHSFFDPSELAKEK